MNVLLFLISLLYNFIKKMIDAYYFINKIVRKNICDKYYYEHKVNDLFSLIFKILFLSIYEFFIFNLFIFIYLISDTSIYMSYFGIFIRFVITYSVSNILLYITKEISYVYHYLYQLLLSICHLFTWINSFVFFILSFKKEFIDVILFKKQFNDIGELIEPYSLAFFQLIKFLIIILHFTNIFSMIRLVEICQNKNEINSSDLIFNSLVYILFDIFILTPGYIFILVLPPVFLFTNFGIFKIVCNKVYNDTDSFPKYNAIKSRIFNDITKVLKYYISIILVLATVPFIWRFHISIRILYELFNENNLEEFLEKYFNNIKNCFFDILKLIMIIIVILLALIMIPFFWKWGKSIKIFVELYRTKEIKKFVINYIYNLFDCFLTIAKAIIYPFNLLSPVHLKALNDCYFGNKNRGKNRKYIFDISLMIFFEKWMDIIVFIFTILRLICINFYIFIIRENCHIKFFSLLFDNEAIVRENSNKENRVKAIQALLFDVIINVLLIFQILLGILNPFFALKIIKEFYLYFFTSKNQTQFKYKLIELKYIYKSINTVLTLLFFYLIYLPISLILNIAAIWTVKYNINLLITNNKTAFNKLKNINNKSEEYINKFGNILNMNKYCKNLELIFNSFIYGYILAFKFIFIHLNIFRIFKLWSKFKKEDKLVFEDAISDQFNYAILEFIYTPFLYVMIILEPWNFEILSEFLEAEDCNSKASKFCKLFIKFIHDIRLIFIFILLMVTLIDTIPTIMLIFRKFKKHLYPTEENKLVYNLHYKTDDFETELRQIYNKNLKKFTTALFFILNILLITRIKPLFKKTWPFFKIFFKNCKRGFINLLKRQKKKNIENGKLIKMPFIIISEICSFLDSGDIIKLSRTNKILNEKANINFIWEKVFYNKYDKKLKEVLTEDEYAKFSHNNLDSYKESCKYYCSAIMKAKGKKIGDIDTMTFTEVVEEETIKSIFNIPILLFFFHYGIWFYLYCLNFILFKIYTLLVSIFSFYQHYDQKKEWDDFNNENIVLDNIYLLFENVFIIILILYNIFIIPQIVLKYIFNIIDFILCKANNLIAYCSSRLHKIGLVPNDVDSYIFINNYLLGNIIRILKIVYNIIIILFNIILISQIILYNILWILNAIIFKIYEILVNVFPIDRLLTKTTINNENFIFINCFAELIILIYQLVLLCYSLILIPQVILMKLLAFNFGIKRNNISLNERIDNSNFIIIILNLIYAFIYLIIIYSICVLPSLYYIFLDLDFKSKKGPFDAIKDLSNILYNSKYYEFIQIFLGKYCLNVISYCFSKLIVDHTIIFVSKTTDILFVKILENIFNEFYHIPFFPIYFPLKYFLMYIGYAFKCISIKTGNISSSCFEIILNVISLVVALIPACIMYACFVYDSKRIIFMQIPLFIYTVFNIWRCGAALNLIEN